MQDIIRSILEHRTIRDYLDQPIPDADLEKILLAARIAPTAYNSQDLSVIVVKDKIRREKIANLAGQSHIANASVVLIFVADLYKTHLACKKNGLKQNTTEGFSGLLSSTLDVGISLGSTIIAAESLGYGTNALASVTTNIEELSTLLELPKYTKPVVGLCIGYPKTIPIQKPRIKLQGFAHEESYNLHAIEGYLNEYDDVMIVYLEEIGRSEIEVNWSKRTAKVFSDPNNKDKYDKLCKFLEKQKFQLEK